MVPNIIPIHKEMPFFTGLRDAMTLTGSTLMALGHRFRHGEGSSGPFPRRNWNLEIDGSPVSERFIYGRICAKQKEATIR
jgi:hypothetical protein